MLQSILFALLLVAAFGFFAWQVRKIRANILVGRDRDMSGNVAERFQKTLLVAFGQQKMFKRLTPALLHLIVYVGFLVINVEVLEIVVDGLFGTHRFLKFLGPVYDGLMATNEILLSYNQPMFHPLCSELQGKSSLALYMDFHQRSSSTFGISFHIYFLRYLFQV